MKTQQNILRYAPNQAGGRNRSVASPQCGRVRLRFAAAVALLLTAGLPTLRAADPPHFIPFQGHLARPSSADPAQYEPVPAGRYDILFTLYAAPVGGESKVWGPERHAQVTVVNGLVNAMLGSVIGFQDAIAANPNFFARPLYVGLTIDADGNPNTADLELVPRQALLPAVYALGALRADRLDGKDWRDFFVGTDDSGTFTPGATKVRDAEKLDGSDWGDFFLGTSGGFTNGITKVRDADKLDGYDWGNVFQNGDPTSTILSARIADHSITAQKIVAQTITAAEVAPGTITSQQIASHTITEANLHTSLTMNSIIPPGTISAFAGPAENIPVGWLLCDGTVVKTNDYPALFAAIGTSWGAGLSAPDDFHLPDLRGMFLRGVNAGLTDATWNDPDAGARQARYGGGNSADAVGSYQVQEFKSHKHSVPIDVGGDQDLRCLAANAFIDEQWTDQYVSASGGHETRPNNAYVVYIIKY